MENVSGSEYKQKTTERKSCLYNILSVTASAKHDIKFYTPREKLYEK